MADEVIVWGYCDANCKHRVLTLDQTANLIQEMAANGFQVPEGFIPVTAVNRVVEQNKGKQYAIFVGTQEQYNAWDGDKDHTIKYITDDRTIDLIWDSIDLLKKSVNKMVDGKTPLSVKKADGTMAQITEDENGVLKFGDVVIPQKKVLFNNEVGQRRIDLSSFNLQAGDRLKFTIKSEEKTDTYGSISKTWEEHEISGEVILGSDTEKKRIVDFTLGDGTMKALFLYRVYLYFDTTSITTIDPTLGYEPETTGAVQILSNLNGSSAADGGNPDVTQAIWDFSDDKNVYDSFINFVITKVTKIIE